MDRKFLISIDLGTTGNRVFCFNEAGQPISNVYSEFTQHFPKAGWVEHDAEEIWESVAKLIPEAIDKGGLHPENALGIGITNQRETTVLWDKTTGKPVYHAIVWQCRRTTDICNDLKKRALIKISGRKQALFSTPISPAQKSSGSSITLPR